MDAMPKIAKMSRRGFLVSLPVLSAFSFIGCDKALDRTGDSMLFSENFPTRLTDVSSIVVHPCKDPIAVLVHIKQEHNTPFSLHVGEDSGIKNSQSNIYSIVNQLRRATGLCHYIIEGLDKNAFSFIRRQLQSIERFSSSQQEEALKKIASVHGSTFGRALRMMLDPKLSMIPVQENMSKELKCKYDALCSDMIKAYDMSRIVREHAQYVLANAYSENAMVEAKRLFPAIDEAREWISLNKQRVLSDAKSFLKENEKAIYERRELDVLSTISAFRRDFRNVCAVGCIFGSNHSFVKHSAREHIAVIEVTPQGLA